MKIEIKNEKNNTWLTIIIYLVDYFLSIENII